MKAQRSKIEVFMARSHEGTFVLVDIRRSRFVIANGFVHVSSPYPPFGPGDELLTYRGGLCVRAYDRGQMVGLILGGILGDRYNKDSSASYVWWDTVWAYFA